MERYDNTLGPLVLSAFVNTYFCGIIGFQMVAYKMANFNDGRVIKASIFILFIVDMFQESVAIYMVWIFCVSNYLNPAAIETVQLWTYTIIPVCNTVSGAIVHLFLSHRIVKQAKRRNSYGIFVGFVSFVSGAFAISSSASSRFSMVKIRTDDICRAFVIAWLAAQALTDIMISASLLAHICFHSKRDCAKKSDLQSRLSRATSHIVQSGTLSAMFAGCTLILFLTSPKTDIYIAFLLPLGRLYTNSFLGVLLARDHIKLKPKSPQVTTDIWALPSGVTDQPQSFNLVRVTTEQEITFDTDGNIGRKTDTRRCSKSDMHYPTSGDRKSMPHHTHVMHMDGISESKGAQII